MQFEVLQNGAEIRRAFTQRFVMSREAFQASRREPAGEYGSIGENWYANSFCWERLYPEYEEVSFADALSLLRRRSGPVIFMGEYGPGKKECLGLAEAGELADRIAWEWYEDYRLEEQMRFNPDAFLATDLYVFDRALSWLIVFTHETTDWESELTDPMKAAASRYCIVFPR